MCGITGFLDLSRQTSSDALEKIAGTMATSLAHRGPDDHGVWVDEQEGIALGHRRLAIIDLSPLGHQPMVSDCGRYVLVFNGEIYNFLALRKDLASKGFEFLGTSDTEVMLAAFRHWGIGESLKRFTGMFSFALWDRAGRKLFLGRDRIGEKPLYYGINGKLFIFASELKALRQQPQFAAEIDRNALALLLRYGYIPAPYSIYRGIYKLLPGTYLELTPGRLGQGELPEPKPYWALSEIVEQGQKEQFAGTEQEAVDLLENLLKEAVAGQMVADVPLGAFLSGGIDSSLVVALMQSQSRLPVKTFTIGFHESDYNEAGYARGVAEHLGTDHTELYVTPKEAMAVISRLPNLYDEPFADSSQIPTYLVAKLAKQKVTVALSGDGGDELFGGYSRYARTQEIWDQISPIPLLVRRGLKRYFPTAGWVWGCGVLDALLLGKLELRRYGRKVQTLMKFLDKRGPEEFYAYIMSFWKQPAQVVASSREYPTVMSDPGQWLELPSFIHRMMYLDTQSYLPDDILVKVDRAAMGVSLETRIPLLDHRVVEFAWSLPLSMKVRNGQGKWILRQLLHRYVPRKLVERSKQGFGVPIGHWLRGPLREWAETLLDETRLKQEGFLDPTPIRRKWEEHLSGHYDWNSYLWSILMFEDWLMAIVQE